jgi:hypothetical protein
MTQLDITLKYIKKRPFTSGKSEKEISSPALNQLVTEVHFSWLKLSRTQILVVTSKGSKKFALEIFYEF